MPFQAIPIALRTNTGDPLSKLIYVALVRACDLGNPAEGIKPRAYMEIEKLAEVCQATVAETRDALGRLDRLGLVRSMGLLGSGEPDYLFYEVKLPMTELEPENRRRIKCSPDQIEAILEREPSSERGCALCGEFVESGWEVDHIIPQSRGGADVEDNCQVVCGPCNSRKGNRVGWLDFVGRRK